MAVWPMNSSLISLSLLSLFVLTSYLDEAVGLMNHFASLSRFSQYILGCQRLPKPVFSGKDDYGRNYKLWNWTTNEAKTLPWVDAYLEWSHLYTIRSRSSLSLSSLGRLLCQNWQPLIMLLWYATSAVICTWKINALPFVPNKLVCIQFKILH